MVRLMIFTAFFTAASVFSCYAGENDPLIQAIDIAQKENPQKAKTTFALQLTKNVCYVARQFKDGSYRTDFFTYQDNKPPVLNNSNQTAEEFQRMHNMKSNIQQGGISFVCFTPRLIELT